VEEDWNDRRMEKEDTISVQWAQEDVETSCNLLNNNNISIVNLHMFRAGSLLIIRRINSV
jgi:hypothetical protein